MKRLLIVVLLASTAFAAPQQLQRQLEAMAGHHHGKVALFARNLKTGDTVAVDADTPVKAASVIKLPIMVEAFYQVKARKLSLTQKRKLTHDNQVPGSGVLFQMDAGLQLTVKDLITLMMDVSDNTAANMLIDRIGIAAVNQRMKSLGLKNTVLYKEIGKPAPASTPEEQKQFGIGKTTARDMADLLASIERCDLGDKQLCGQMIEIMKHQQYRNMIPHYFDEGDPTEEPSFVADKIGMLDDVRNDVGIVYTLAGPIVISAFTYDNQDHRWVADSEPEILIARMSQMIVAEFSPVGIRDERKKEDREREHEREERREHEKEPKK